MGKRCFYYSTDLPQVIETVPSDTKTNCILPLHKCFVSKSPSAISTELYRDKDILGHTNARFDVNEPTVIKMQNLKLFSRTVMYGFFFFYGKYLFLQYNTLFFCTQNVK